MFRSFLHLIGILDRDSVLLQKAISEGSVDEVQQLLNRGVNPNIPYQGLSPLFFCLKGNQLDIALILIEKGANVNWKDERGRTVLFSSIELENNDFFYLFIKSGCDVNISDKNGFTPLHLAIESTEYKIYVQTLIEKGAEVDACSHCKKTPLHVAIELMSPVRVRFLLQYRPKVQVNEYHNLIDMALERFSDAMKIIIDDLVNYGFRVQNKKLTDNDFLYIVVNRNLERLAEILLQIGVNPNTVCRGSSLLGVACKNGHINMVKMLLRHGVNVSTCDDALVLAVQRDHPEIVLELLKRETRKRVSELAYIAVEYTSPKTLRCLLEYESPRFNVNSLYNGRTLAFEAAVRDKYKIIEILWMYGADLVYPGRMRHSPLHSACRLQRDNATETILRLGGDVNSLNRAGKSPVELLNKHDLATLYHIRKHILALGSAGFYLNDCNLAFALVQRERILLAELDSELETMKANTIPNSHITFYRLLMSSESDLGHLVNNPDITGILKSEEYKTKFQHYYNFLRKNILIGLKRKAFIDGFYDNVVSRSDFIRLPSTCIRQILSSISNKDLGIMSGYYRQPEELKAYGRYYEETSSEASSSDSD